MKLNGHPVLPPAVTMVGAVPLQPERHALPAAVALPVPAPDGKHEGEVVHPTRLHALPWCGTQKFSEKRPTQRPLLKNFLGRAELARYFS